jgi:hypothetical protein
MDGHPSRIQEARRLISKVAIASGHAHAERGGVERGADGGRPSNPNDVER